MALVERLGLSFVHPGRNDTINDYIISFYVEYIIPSPVVRNHMTSFGMYLKEGLGGRLSVKAGIKRQHLNFDSHIISIPNCSFLGHHLIKECPQLSYILKCGMADTNFIDAHNPDEPVQSVCRNTRQRTSYLPSHPHGKRHLWRGPHNREYRHKPQRVLQAGGAYLLSSNISLP